MQMVYVLSSSIHSAGYEVMGKELYVWFHNGSVYRYFNVPLWAFEEFIDAPSKGTYFNHYIRKNYAYEKVSLAA